MEAGKNSGCHQLPERSFFYKGWQLPVCARCVGVIIGYITAAVLAFFIKPHIVTIAVCCLVMLCDWLLQFLKIKESTNPRRLITGIIGGYGVMSGYIFVAFLIIRLLK